MYYYEFHFKSKMIENDRVCFLYLAPGSTGYFKAYKERKLQKMMLIIMVVLTTLNLN
jgi:hypothetical protein